MTSVERVVEYAELESEAPWETDVQPPRDWPTRGGITFDRVNFSYSASEPLVLKNLTVVFKPREKVLIFILTCACLLVSREHGSASYGANVKGGVVLLFYVALFSNQLLKGPCIMLLNLQNYTICDSWNTYHVIKTVQVDPFVPNLHFHLREDDNYLFTVRQMRGRGC